MSAFLRGLRRAERRLVPALLAAAGVTLLAAGVLAWAPPPGSMAPTQAPTGAIDSPAPSATGSGAPASSTPGGTGLASGSPGFSPPIPVTPTPGPTTSPLPEGTATRVVIPALKIDLPVIEGDGTFPPCDVALFLPSFQQPGQPGTTYLYGHAREGMLLPLLAQSKVNNGKKMLGYSVLVYTTDNKVYWYEISEVKRDVKPTDWTITEIPEGEQQLILQTSETPFASGTKLQVAAKPVLVQDAEPEEANPTPKPRKCS
jgi:LPXTG-site transpeptidase (sortase) family protein